MKPSISERLRNLSPRTKLFLTISGAIVVIDQITKFIAVGALTRAFEGADGEPVGFLSQLGRFLTVSHPTHLPKVEVVQGLWNMRYAENTGAAFSFLAGAAQWFRLPFFLLVASGAMVFIVRYFQKTTPEQRVLRVALASVFGGAFGNFLDRLHLGYVIDFVEWHWYDVAAWPAFNIADVGISVGVGLLLLDMLLQRAPERTAEPAGDGGASQASRRGKGKGGMARTVESP